jgi:egghead protein (zeste-white 4 protein)
VSRRRTCRLPQHSELHGLVVVEGPTRLVRPGLTCQITKGMADVRMTISSAPPAQRDQSSTEQPRRRVPRSDWGVGPITGHRLTVVASMIFLTSGLYAFQSAMWPHGGVELHGSLGRLVEFGQVLWVFSLPVGVLGLVGTLSFRHPEHLHTVRRIPQFVSFRIVSRGTNIEALASTIQRCLSEMARSPLFDFVIEVVVEPGCQVELLPSGPRIRVLAVPRSYQTDAGSMFKARALHYALEASSLPDQAWIVHLDEETHPTSSGIRGIAEMIAAEEQSQELRVGQGAILYHRNWKRHPIMTLADMHRTGDDFARFYLQHRIGITLFGLHGSFIVVRNDVEKQIGFDFGPVGSITEDAFWALKLMEAGGRSRWVHGYLEEQSTQGWRDFIKQRKRWFQGLVLVGLHAPASLRWRLPLLVFTLLWAVAPVAVVYTDASHPGRRDLRQRADSLRRRPSVQPQRGRHQQPCEALWLVDPPVGTSPVLRDRRGPRRSRGHVCPRRRLSHREEIGA